jgi:KRAB domain-containing zinc finger protein
MSEKSLGSHKHQCHSSAWASAQMDMFSCSQCFKDFQNLHALTEHVSIHRPTATKLNQSELELSLKPEDYLEVIDIAAVPPPSTQNEEKEKTSSYVPSNTDESHSLSESPHSGDSNKFKKRKKPSKIYVCDICQRIFSLACRFNQHMNIHTGDMPFACRKPGCDRHFATKGSRSSHEHIQHSDGDRVLCPVCGRGFRGTKHLRHHELVHVSVGSLICNVCGAAFKRQSALKRHVATHTGDRRVTCDQCLKEFAGQHQLKRHISDIHMKKKEFKCLVCSKEFSQHTNLQTHMRTHTGAKPFACSDCDMKFSHRVSLKSHIKVKHRFKT